MCRLNPDGNDRKLIFSVVLIGQISARIESAKNESQHGRIVGQVEYGVARHTSGEQGQPFK
jgi:hypothetical protein